MIEFGTSGSVQRRLIILLIVIFACLRLSHLDYKAATIDELMTEIRTSGNTSITIQKFFNDHNHRVVTGAELHELISDPDNLNSIENSFLKEEPQTSPLIYFVYYLWGWVFDHDLFYYRLISAIFGIVFLGLIYTVSKVCIGDELVAIIATALASASPVFMIYSQMAREHIFFAALYLAGLLCYWYQLNRPTRISFISVTAVQFVGLFVSIKSITWIVATFIGQMALNVSRKIRVLDKSLTFGALISISAFMAAWGAIPLARLTEVKENIGAVLIANDLITYFNGFIRVFSILFYDDGRPIISDGLPNFVVLLPIGLLQIVAIANSFSYRRRWFYGVTLLISFSPLVLVVIDRIFGSSTALVPRYQLLFYVSQFVVVATFLASLIRDSKTKTAGTAVLLSILGLSTFSSFDYITSPYWWSSKPLSLHTEISKLKIENETSLFTIDPESIDCIYYGLITSRKTGPEAKFLISNSVAEDISKIKWRPQRIVVLRLGRGFFQPPPSPYSLNRELSDRNIAIFEFHR